MTKWMMELHVREEGQEQTYELWFDSEDDARNVYEKRFELWKEAGVDLKEVSLTPPRLATRPKTAKVVRVEPAQSPAPSA